MIQSVILSQIFPFPALFESFICFLVPTCLPSFYLFIHAWFAHPFLSDVSTPLQHFTWALSCHLFIHSPVLESCFCLASPSVLLHAFLSCLHLLHSSEGISDWICLFHNYKRPSANRREIKVSESQSEMFELFLSAGRVDNNLFLCTYWPSL